MEQTPNKSQHTELTLEQKILPPLLPGFELATFRSRVRRSNQQAIPAPIVYTKYTQMNVLWTTGGEKNTVPGNGFKQCDFTSVAGRKGN